ncbi:hypothetical protein [Streptomyces sp. NPDC005760]|uniref:hypothetical protein n=1 Tax=Streptomyces sp. NPDC005760 TaxID=3156718 RepID=UPI00340E375F
MIGGTPGADSRSAAPGAGAAGRKPDLGAIAAVCTGVGSDRTSASVWGRTEAYACSVTYP